MTAKEALRYIKYATTLKLDFNGQGQIVGDDTIEELRQVIISALEKQISKKTKETEAYPHRLYCPECYFTLAFNKDNLDFIKSNQMYNYCPACGQALDWSDTECQK